MRFVAISLILILALFVTPVGIGRQSKSSVLPDMDTSQGFLKICDAVDKNSAELTDLEKFETGYCLGWIAGFTSGIQVAEVRYRVVKETKIYCLPEGSNYGQMIHIVKKFIADHPEKEHLPTAAIAGTALADAFPCKESK